MTKRYCTRCFTLGILKVASFSNGLKCNKLCAKHAREQGTYSVQSPCLDCLAGGVRKQGTFRYGKLRLCSKHARQRGVVTTKKKKFYLCPDCTQPRLGTFKSPTLKKVRYCCEHAVKRGLHTATLAGSSKIACAFFDALERETGERHEYRDRYVDGQVIRNEKRGLIPGRKQRPDSYVEARKEVWLFHGTYFHGCPKEMRHEIKLVHGVGRQSLDVLWNKTLRSMQRYKENGFSVKYVLEHEFRKHRTRPSQCVRTLSESKKNVFSNKMSAKEQLHKERRLANLKFDLQELHLLKEDSDRKFRADKQKILNEINQLQGGGGGTRVEAPAAPAAPPPAVQASPPPPVTVGKNGGLGSVVPWTRGLKCPIESAALLPLGTERKGRDGEMWNVVQVRRKSGNVCRKWRQTLNVWLAFRNEVLRMRRLYRVCDVKDIPRVYRVLMKAHGSARKALQTLQQSSEIDRVAMLRRAKEINFVA